MNLFADEDIALPSPRTSRAPTRAAQGAPKDVEDLIGALKRRYGDRIVAECTVREQTARWVDFPAALDPRIITALAARGIRRLYSHQRETIEHAFQGRHVVIATPTASGKSLCYNLPVLQAALTRRGKSLYLFPTKALAQDQVAELIEIDAAGSLGLRAYTFDGDTPADARQAVRLHGGVVVSNPDMLHQGILPQHTKWAQLFENLAFVVIDELHTYRGVFGSQFANVMRRLKRILRFYRASPTFILSSATIANPRQLAEHLIGEVVEVVTASGAPRGRKTVLIWNPPVVNSDLGLRASTRSQTTRIARHALKRGLKTIVFANSRLEVEVLTKYLKDVFDPDPRRPARVAAYRGGYLPTERRGKERRLRAGEIDCVVSTSALELGVDIGVLDVCVLNGYPGTVAPTWQRLGRSGRRQRASLGVLVASSNLLDQYLARNPEFFLGASPEHASIAPDQLLILMDHVRCAAFELPFRDGEVFGKEDLPTLLDYLAEQGVLHRDAGGWHWIAEGYPANSVSLRSVADGNFAVIDITHGGRKVIAEVDHSSAALTLYEGAIYMVQASPWQVERLDWVGRKAYVRRTDAGYYTDAIDYTKLKVLEEFESDSAGAGSCALGEVHVARRVAGYKKIRYYTHENIGYGPVNLPDHEMHTSALWWRLPNEVLWRAFRGRHEALDGFLGAAYALHHVAALLCMCDVRDLGRAVGDGADAWSAVVAADARGMLKPSEHGPGGLDRAHFKPTAFLYDNYPGGMGLAATLYELRQELVRRAAALIDGCACASGCPACVGPTAPRAHEDALSPKQAARSVLVLLNVREGTVPLEPR